KVLWDGALKDGLGVGWVPQGGGVLLQALQNDRSEALFTCSICQSCPPVGPALRPCGARWNAGGWPLCHTAGIPASVKWPYCGAMALFQNIEVRDADVPIDTSFDHAGRCDTCAGDRRRPSCGQGPGTDGCRTLAET